MSAKTCDTCVKMNNQSTFTVGFVRIHFLFPEIMAAAAVTSVLNRPELLEEIISHLDLESIKTACLVSK